MFTVTIPVANIASANAALQAAGWGKWRPGNFSLPICTSGAMPSIAPLDHLPNVWASGTGGIWADEGPAP